MALLRTFVQKARKGYMKTLMMPQEVGGEGEKQVVIAQIQPLPMLVQVVGPIQVPIQPIIQPIHVPVKIDEERTTTHRIVTEETEYDISELRPRRIHVKGLKIPQFVPREVHVGKLETTGQRMGIQLAYPLIPKRPKKGEKIYAWARIFFDQKLNKYVYQVVEPPMSAKMREIMMKIKELLEQKLDIEFSQMRTFEAKSYIRQQVSDIIGYYGFSLGDEEKEILHYYMEREFIGLGRIEPLMQDEQIEDVSCDGLDIPIFVFHRNPQIGSVMTNVAYHDSEELDSFVVRLAQVANKSISVASPLLSGSLPDGSRVQATLATDIARRGSNFTIRKFTEKPLTPIHLLNYGTIDIKTLAFLWLAVDFGKSILVSGGTASGKTSLLNVLSLFIRPEKKIVSIEDTPELKLPHPHWVPQVARSAIGGERERKFGEVDLFDLLKESLRQRPDYIIVGEVRGPEAYVLFQEMATGHPSLSTIHAENMSKLIDRLTTPPISLPPNLITSADIILFLIGTRYHDRQVRRVNEVLEVIAVDPETKQPLTNQVFRWDPISDTFVIEGSSIVLKEIAEESGMTEKEITDELERRMMILEWMRQRNLTEYTDVNAVVNYYYSFPERVIASITSTMR
ncbi:MAG TPA: type II/IV secretion system ATPase subunit [archaeon]|nr:type II/IV secretion system ATPase subunit [archaeon]